MPLDPRETIPPHAVRQIQAEGQVALCIRIRELITSHQATLTAVVRIARVAADMHLLDPVADPQSIRTTAHKSQNGAGTSVCREQVSAIEAPLLGQPSAIEARHKAKDIEAMHAMAMGGNGPCPHDRPQATSGTVTAGAARLGERCHLQTGGALQARLVPLRCLLPIDGGRHMTIDLTTDLTTDQGAGQTLVRLHTCA